MTDPNGEMFVSYRRNQADIAEALVKSLHEHGIRTWRDVSDLRTEPTQAELRRVLDGSDLAGGIVLVSEDVAESEIILELELPELHDRWRNDEDFFVVIALCPGVDYDDAEEILGECPTVRDFSGWNMIKLGSQAETPAAADDVTTDVLTERVRLIHEQLNDDEPLDCSIDTYGPPTYSPQPTVAIDWSSYFADGLPTPRIWDQRLIPRLNEVIDIVEESAPERPLRFRGHARLPTAFALGRCLQTTRGVDTTWLQRSGGQHNPWNVHSDAEESGLDGDLHVNNVSGSDLAVLVSVTNEVDPAVGRSDSELPDFGGVLELSVGDDVGSSLTSSEAAHAAGVFQQEIQRALNQLSATSTIHLFMAVPVGLAFLFGQQTNTFPPVQTYILPDGERTYQQAAVVQNHSRNSDHPERSSENQKPLRYRLWNSITDWTESVRS